MKREWLCRVIARHRNANIPPGWVLRCCGASNARYTEEITARDQTRQRRLTARLQLGWLWVGIRKKASYSLPVACMSLRLLKTRHALLVSHASSECMRLVQFSTHGLGPRVECLRLAGFVGAAFRQICSYHVCVFCATACVFYRPSVL